MVDFIHEAASRGPSALADILVCDCQLGYTKSIFNFKCDHGRKMLFV